MSEELIAQQRRDRASGRHEFEKWCVDFHGYTLPPKRDYNNPATYIGAEARILWDAWQAAWNTRTPSVEGPLVEIVREYIAELDNPSPDWAMRKHWRDKMRAALASYRKTATLKA